MRRSHLALVLLIAGAACVLLLRGPDTDVDPATRERKAPRTTGETPVLLRGTGRGPDVAPLKRQTDSPAPGKGPEDASLAPRIVLPITVRVEGADGPVAFDPPATLGLYPVMLRIDSTYDFKSVEMAITETGAVELDVGEPLREYWSRRSSRGADVLLRHPSYLPVEIRIPVPAAGERLKPLDLLLRPASPLRGRVVGPEGKPIKGATVFLYPMTPDGPDRIPTAEGYTTEGGGFELQYGSDGRYLLAATWAAYTVGDGRMSLIAAQLKPASETLDLVVGHPPPEVCLRLRPSHSIRGRVLVDGHPVDLASVEWKLRSPGRRLATSARPGTWEWSGLIYADREVHCGWDDVNTDRDGRFEIHGLSARPYSLAVSALGRAQVHPKVTEQVVRTITPPRADVLFDIHLARVEVLVTHEGSPVQDLEVHVLAVGMEPGLPEGLVWGTHIQETDAHGRAEIAISPTGLYYVFIRDARYDLFHEKVEAPAAGETHVVRAELKRARPKPRLLVTLVGEGSDSLKSAGFGFYPPDKNRTSRTPWPIRSVKSTDGRFVLEDMVPGRFRLHVRPGRFWAWKPNEWAEATQIVEIPESGDTVVRVPIVKGGRLHVTVTDTHGRHLGAGCRIGDSGGTWIRAWFVAEDAMGSTVSSGNGLPGVGPSWVEPVLPPGTYTLSFTLIGFRSETRRVELKPGAASIVRFVMQSLR